MRVYRPIGGVGQCMGPGRVHGREHSYIHPAS